MERLTTTNCVIVASGQVLLGMKKRGFGQGRWNGFGGKVQDGETIVESAKREILEEVGLHAIDVELAGVIDFVYRGKDREVEVHFLTVTSFHGQPQETEEMRPQWFGTSEIPFKDMWPDCEYWMPLLLSGHRFKGQFVFEGYDAIVTHELDVIDSGP